MIIFRQTFSVMFKDCIYFHCLLLEILNIKSFVKIIVNIVVVCLRRISDTMLQLSVCEWLNTERCASVCKCVIFKLRSVKRW